MGHNDKKTLPPTEKIRGLPLTTAQLIVHLEAFITAYALPLAVAGLFVGLALVGFFGRLFPWLHLVVLGAFLLWFCIALSKAFRSYRKPTLSTARRRIESVNRLRHRPLDVMDDRPAVAGDTERRLWDLHKRRSREQLKNLKLPYWQLSFAERDPYALRYGLILLLLVGVGAGWGHWGERLIHAINPALGQGWKPALPTLNAWITPPEYTGLPPVMIATPAGVRYAKETLKVPAGSTLSIHLSDSRHEPQLKLGSEKTAFAADAANNYSITRTLDASGDVAIERGWQTIANWNISVQPDQPPTVEFSEDPAATERKAVKLAYKASDDYAVAKVTAIISPTMSLPGQDNAPLELILTEAKAKDLAQTEYQDLTGHPWAGTPVQIELLATDAVGQVAHSSKKTFTLPERVFINPVAKALIEERKKLLLAADQPVRNEAANIMAGIARQPAAYGGDAVVLMALRGGAVRLILDRATDAPQRVGEIMWNSAARIEDGGASDAENLLRMAQNELSDALERNASEAEIQQLIDQVQAALQNYLRELSRRVAQQPPLAPELQQLGQQMNMLSPDDLQNMLNELRGLSASGQREALQQRLEQMRQMLENLRTGPMELPQDVKDKLQQMGEMRSLAKQQQELIDKTFKAEQQNDPAKRAADLQAIAQEQNELLKKLKALMERPGAAENLGEAGAAMAAAADALKQGKGEAAQQSQGEALQALQAAGQQMAQQLSQQLKIMALPGMAGARPGQGRDPLGRPSPNGAAQDDGSVKVPDQMTIQKAREILDELQRRAGDSARPETERDYIDRLLQRF